MFLCVPKDFSASGPAGQPPSHLGGLARGHPRPAESVPREPRWGTGHQAPGAIRPASVKCREHWSSVMEGRLGSGPGRGEGRPVPKDKGQCHPCNDRSWLTTFWVYFINTHFFAHMKLVTRGGHRMSLATQESPRSLRVSGGTPLILRPVTLGKFSLRWDLTPTESDSTHMPAPSHLACAWHSGPEVLPSSCVILDGPLLRECTTAPPKPWMNT